MNDYKNIYSSITNNQQNLRELIRLTFLNLMSVQGVVAKTIIRNYNNKQQRGNNEKIKVNAYEYKELNDEAKFQAKVLLDEIPFDYDTGEIDENGKSIMK
jgi:hypothetical protein